MQIACFAFDWWKYKSENKENSASVPERNAIFCLTFDRGNCPFQTSIFSNTSVRPYFKLVLRNCSNHCCELCLIANKWLKTKLLLGTKNVNLLNGCAIFFVDLAIFCKYDVSRGRCWVALANINLKFEAKSNHKPKFLRERETAKGNALSRELTAHRPDCHRIIIHEENEFFLFSILFSSFLNDFTDSKGEIFSVLYRLKVSGTWFGTRFRKAATNSEPASGTSISCHFQSFLVSPALLELGLVKNWTNIKIIFLHA